MRRLVVALIIVGACSAHGPRRIGEQPSWRRTTARAGAAGSPVALAPASGRVALAPASGPVAFAPAGGPVAFAPVAFAPASEPAARYAEAQPLVPHTALGDAVIAAVRDAAVRAGVPVPQPDARLFRACAALAEAVPEEGVIGYALVEFALQHGGIIEPSPHLLVVWGDIGSPELVVEEIAPRLAEILGGGAMARLGVGAARRKPDGTGAVVFALQSSAVSIVPIPRAIPGGGSVALDAVVDPRYHDPEVFVTFEGGDTRQLVLRPGRPGGFVTQIACGPHKGRLQIEIVASDASGSTVLANFPVWCAVAPPRSIPIDPVRDDARVASPEQAERGLLASINRDRAAAGVPILRRDDTLVAVARSYSDEMRRTRAVAHVSPITGSAADRVRAAGVKTAVVLENVALAYGIDEAHRGLMNSPGHRANILSAVATHIGIGVTFGDEVSGRREMFVTEVFTRVPPKIDPGQVALAVRDKLAAARPRLSPAARLDRLAQELADGVAAGNTADAAYQAIRGRINGLGKIYQRVGSVITPVADAGAIDGAGLLGSAAGDEFGLGIAQGPHPQIGDTAIWIVVLLADRRAP